MQNGFRRIALAQGLLPERLPSGQVPARSATSDAPRLDHAEARHTAPGAADREAEMLVAGFDVPWAWAGLTP
jgi:hypothetical protein